MPNNLRKNNPYLNDDAFTASIKPAIERLLKPRREEIINLLELRLKTRKFEEKKNIDKKINSFVDEINSLEIKGEKISAEELALGRVEKLEDFVIDKEYTRYQKEAENCVLKGQYVPQFLFAGGATRLGLGTMWGVNLASIGEVVLGNYGEAEKYITKDNIGKILVTLGKDKEAQNFISAQEVEQFKLTGPETLTNAQFETVKERLKSYREGERPVQIGMGPRQLLQYRLKLEELTKKTRVKGAVCRAQGKGKEVNLLPCTEHHAPSTLAPRIARANLILNFNSDVYNEAKNDLVKNNFYGFNPENIYILVQPTYRSNKIKTGEMVENVTSAPLPYGHGHATMQLVTNNEAVKLDKKGNETVIKGNVARELSDRSCKLIGTHRINDMTKWTDDVVDIERVAFGLYQIERMGKEAVIELVANPNNQKGGHWFKARGKEFLAETLSTNRPDLKKFLSGLKNAPYNAFRNMYSVKAFSEKLGSCGGIKLNLKYKEGSFYLESVTGDITLALDSAAFSKKDEVIHDLKNVRDYVLEGIYYSARQQKDPLFLRLARELK